MLWMKRPLAVAMLTSLTFGLTAYAVSVSAATYTVQPGDTLSHIAEANKISLEKLAKWNRLDNLDLILAGQVLTLTADIQLPEPPAPEPVVEAAPQPVQQVYQAQPAPTPQVQLSVSEAEAKEIIAFKESGGSYTAQNGQYYGRYQLSLSYLNGDLSPANQERVADQYVLNRYGSWAAALGFWSVNGWY